MKQVSRVIISSGERVLLGKRSRGVESGKLSILGGKIDENENPEQAAHREILEETGLFLSTITFFIVDYFNGWESHYFTASVEDEVMPSLTEHDEVRFFSREELKMMKDEVAFNHYLILEQYFRSLS
ncbi:NUDIX hydrolase [Patescibacteria group bacterium]|nr:NUDIX hydrolase [Patescibacteria group bacterium]